MWGPFLAASALGPYINRLIMDMDQPRAYVEHPEHGLKMIYLDEREDYLKKGWHKPGEKPVKKEEPVNELSDDTEKSFDDVKDSASELSEWLNKKFGLSTNRRQGLRKLLGIAYDNGVEDH